MSALKDVVVSLGFFSSGAAQGVRLNRKDERVRAAPHAFVPLLPNKVDLQRAVIAQQTITHTDGSGRTRVVHAGQVIAADDESRAPPSRRDLRAIHERVGVPCTTRRHRTRWQANPPVLRVTSAARTATGNSVALPRLEKGARLASVIDITAASGTGPSLTLTVEWSHDGGTTFAQGDTADTFTALTATSTKVKDFQMKSDTYRYVWTISGTSPSFTFTIRDYVAGPS